MPSLEPFVAFDRLSALSDLSTPGASTSALSTEHMPVSAKSSSSSRSAPETTFTVLVVDRADPPIVTVDDDKAMTVLSLATGAAPSLQMDPTALVAGTAAAASASATSTFSSISLTRSIASTSTSSPENNGLGTNPTRRPIMIVLIAMGVLFCFVILLVFVLPVLRTKQRRDRRLRYTSQAEPGDLAGDPYSDSLSPDYFSGKTAFPEAAYVPKSPSSALNSPIPSPVMFEGKNPFVHFEATPSPVRRAPMVRRGLPSSPRDYLPSRQATTNLDIPSTPGAFSPVSPRAGLMPYGSPTRDRMLRPASGVVTWRIEDPLAIVEEPGLRSGLRSHLRPISRSIRFSTFRDRLSRFSTFNGNSDDISGFRQLHDSHIPDDPTWNTSWNNNSVQALVQRSSILSLQVPKSPSSVSFTTHATSKLGETWSS